MPYNKLGRPENSNPAVSGKNVSGSDTVALFASGEPHTRFLYVGKGGNLRIAFEDVSAGVTLASVASGTWLNVAPKYVLASGTTASGVVAFY